MALRVNDIVYRLNAVPNDTAKEAMEEILRLRQLASIRGARMQIMLARLNRIELVTSISIPEVFKGWFDDDGVPK